MAAIDDVAARQGINATGRNTIAASFWVWYYNHQNDKFTIPVKVWVINVTANITLAQMRPLFVLLFGEDPAH